MTLLKTNRTIVRAFAKEDLASLIELMSDSDVMKYTGFREPQSKEKIEQCLECWTQEGSEPLGVWCAVEKDTDEFVGWFMLKDTGHSYPELGFMLSKKKWGLGYATEISQEFIKYAFHQLNYKKVIATTVRENLASISVLKKLGMVSSPIELKEDGNYEILCFEINAPID